MRNKRKFYTIVNACVTAVISCAFVAFGVLRFPLSYARLKESVFDLFGGALYYFRALFGGKRFPRAESGSVFGSMGETDVCAEGYARLFQVG